MTDAPEYPHRTAQTDEFDAAIRVVTTHEHPGITTLQRAEIAHIEHALDMLANAVSIMRLQLDVLKRRMDGR